MQQPYNLAAIYIYDVESAGIFKIEYQDITGNWVTLLEYYTVYFNRWTPVTNLNITAQNLRFTKLQNAAKIAEVAIFGIPVLN